MDCQKVRERAECPEEIKTEEAMIFVRHLRTCPDCRVTIPLPKRVAAIDTIVLRVND